MYSLADFRAAPRKAPTKGKILDRVICSVKEKPGLTVGELHKFVAIGTRENLSKILCLAFQLGYIRKGTKRACSVSGRRVWTWLPLRGRSGMALPVL